MLSIANRLNALDWGAIERDLDAHGWARVPELLDSAECRSVAELFGDRRRFRSTVEMERHQYGVGTYRYFRYPLPDLVQAIREAAYPHLAPIANRWRERVMRAPPYPATLAEFLAVCAAAGQKRPTPLVLHYQAGGYNELHRDIYGRVAFPFQLVIVLSRRCPAGDAPPEPGGFRGGEFWLVEEPKDGPPRESIIPADRGDCVIFATKFRPEPVGQRWRQSPLRHGARLITAGERHALGVIFHDGK